MLHFIPAWYQRDTWSEIEQKWYSRRMRTEFDDTVKQIQLFHRNQTYPYMIMLLSYTPNFRHFLHRQAVYHAPYWSCFDAIQQINRTKVMVLSFHNLNWPKGVEFVYSPFAVIAYLNGVRYAQVEFGEDGNPIQIDIFKNSKLNRRNMYDDRGFVSSTILYDENEQPMHQDFLMENGVWKMRHYFNDDHVDINPTVSKYTIRFDNNSKEYDFAKIKYDNIEEIIIEVVHKYISNLPRHDIFCAAVHDRNINVLNKVFGDRKMILSFFENRFAYIDDETINSVVQNADYVISDSLTNTRIIKETYGDKIKNFIEITPYDSRADFGISQTINVQKILVPIDRMDDNDFDKLILILAKYLNENKYAQIHLFTRNALFNIKKDLLSRVSKLLVENGFPKEWTEEEEKDNNKRENLLDQEKRISQKFFVEQCIDELEVSKCMREQRIIVDVRKQPELYLQITAISVGIPQIVNCETQYVEHKLNGYIMKSFEDIPKQLEFYLASLNNWNSALVGCYEIGKKFTTKVLLDSWKEVLETVERD